MSPSRFSSRPFLLSVGCIGCFTLSVLFTGPPLFGQAAGDADDRERVTADRYLQVLLRRPRPGVALDRVYGFHVQNDSLEQLEQQLNQPGDDSESRRMVWGLIQLQRGRSAEAAAILAEVEGSLPTDAACSYYLGRAYLAVGQTELAAEAMERAIEKQPARAEALPMFTELGRIYSRAGQRDKSLSVWTRLETLFPGDTRVGGQIANTLAEEGNHEEAKRRYEALAESARKPDDQVTFAVRAAEMQRELGDEQEAIAALESILNRLRPGSWLYTDVRSRIEAGFLKSGDYDALAEYYQKQLEQRPDDLALRTRLARIMITAGRLVEAKELLTSAIERAPEDVDSRLALIDVLVRQADVKSAAVQFEALVKRDPENPDHLIRWGQILLDDAEAPLEQRRADAAAVWQRLADARGEDAVTLSQVADLMRGIDRSNDAITLYRKAIEIDPASPQYREYLGEYLHQLGRTDEAIEQWRGIAAGDRRTRDSLVRLAEVFGAFKMPDLALQTWEEASEFDLTFAHELRYAKKLSEANRYDDALARLDQAAKMAETPDENEQLLRDRIAIYQASGTLEDQIAKASKQSPTASVLRQLALMYGAAGDVIQAERAIREAMELAPDDTAVLLVGAELAERQNRFDDAAELFGKLAGVDNRFRTNYLQRVASLRVRLGQTDQAMKTCEAIIDANPASPESYLFFARTGFNAGHEEEAIAALRRAMTVAPRDNGPRRMLAAHFAERYRTDEAIELYWRAIDFETQLDEKINVIRALAPLYDRKADVDALVSRIEAINREEGDTRATQLMIAAAYESIQDFGAARESIDQLLADQPRDLKLLENMVRLSEAADEIEVAAEYQQRVTDLAGTPENRFRLMQLQLDAGLIDVSQALSQRLAMLSDPERLGGMIRSAVRRGELKTARAICREVVRGDDSLWDIKLMLAELLLMEADGDDGDQRRAEAMTLANELRALRIPADSAPPTRANPKASVTSRNSAAANRMVNPLYWSQAGYSLARMYRVGRYSSSNYSSSSSVSLVEPASFGHARVIAGMLILINEGIGRSGDEATAAYEKKLSEDFALSDPEAATDVVEIWEQLAFRSALSMFGGSAAVNPYQAVPSSLTGDARKRAEEQKRVFTSLIWNLAERDAEYGLTPVLQLLSQRLLAATLPSQNQPDMAPLSEEQLEVLGEIHSRIQRSGFPNSISVGMPSGAAEMMLQAVLGNEFKIAGKADDAERFAPEPPGPEADYKEIMGAIQFYLQLQQPDEADSLVSRLLPAARRADASQSSGSQIGMPSSYSTMLRGNDEAIAFYKRHSKTLLDASIAMWCQAQMNSYRRTSTLGDGYIDTYTQVGNSMRSVRLRGPLSSRLMDSALAQMITLYADQGEPDSQTNRVTKLTFSDDMLRHLTASLEGASDQELKTRQVVAAYANWWAERPQRCYELLADLCQRYPADVDLQIERARLASELKQPRLALEQLDSFSPLDSEMLIRKEMAAMNLAAEIGDTERAKLAAERLFGMRLDVKMQLALADQLKRLGLGKQAKAMLQRTRSSRVRNESTELQIARAFLANDDREAAAEVAYTLFRRLASGRSTSNNNNNNYYQQQVVSILKSAGRLEPLIERAKRRVESAPNALRPKQELAELYTAAGRSEDAQRVWEGLSEDTPQSADQMIKRAESLVSAKQYEEAVDLYVEAFEKDPSRMNNDFYRMTNAVRRAGNDATDRLFERLMDFPVEKIPSYRLDEITRLGDRNEMSDAKRKLIGRLLTAEGTQSQIYNIMRSIPQDQRSKITEYRDALMTAACSDDAFSIASEFWTVRTRGSGGKAYGPLEDLVTLLLEDPEAMKRFREAAAKRQETEELKRTADFMLALVDILRLKEDDSEAVEANVATIRELLVRESESDNPTGSPPSQLINSGLLWQSGQLLEDVEAVPADLLIALYSEVQLTDRTTGSSPQFTIDERLVGSYIKAGRKAEARDLVIKLYRAVDFSEQNRYNPGYGDYQYLETSQWAAQRLVTCEAPIDALIIYQKCLADPGAFARAKQWGGDRDRAEKFQQSADAAEKLVTPTSAVEHLRRMATLWETDLDANPIELMEAEMISASKSDKVSSLSIALKTAMSDESVHDDVAEFARRVDALAEKPDAPWQLTALRLMNAIYLSSDRVDELEKQLLSQLPDAPESSDGDTEVDDAFLKVRPLYDLIPVAKSASESDRKSDHGVAKRLAEYLGRIAEATNDSSVAIALAGITGDASGSIGRILDVVESRVTPGAALPEDVAEQCLAIAEDAAEAGDLEASLRALTLALGSGPPLRKLATGGDAFAINQSSGSVNANDATDDLEKLADRVALVIDKLEKSLGEPLHWEKGLEIGSEPAKDPELWRNVADSFLAICVPPDRSGLFFAYPKPIATKSYDRLGSNDNIVVQSASMALAIAAVRSGRVDEISQALQKRHDAAVDKEAPAAALVQLAIVSNNPQRLRTALESFRQVIDSKLPESGKDLGSPAAVSVITSQMAEESRQKSGVIDTVMHTVWPLYVSAELDELSGPKEEDRVAAARLASELMTRTERLIQSDGYTANRHRQIRDRIGQRRVFFARLSGDAEVIDGYIESELQTIETQNYPSSGDLEDYKRRALERVIGQLFENRLTAYMDQPLRRYLTVRTAEKRDYSDRFEPQICLEISSLPPEQRWDLLRRITLGRDPQDPVLFFDGLVNYEFPPEPVHRQFPKLEALKGLPTSTSEFPVVNSVLMLADLAASLGRTDALIDEFNARGKQDDEQLAMAKALIHLAQAKAEKKSWVDVAQTVEPTLKAVAERIRNEKPNKNVDGVAFPALEAHLVIRAADFGAPDEMVNSILDDLKVHATRQRRNHLVSAIARVISSRRQGRAGGAVAQSPLDDFIVVPIANRYRGDSTLLGPLFKSRKDGLVSGTSGYHQNHLMFKYPVQGTFTFSANIRDGSWGEADVAYGGVIYQANGWQSNALLIGMGERGQVKFTADSIKRLKDNEEAVSVSPQEVVGLCNGEAFVTDIFESSFPFASVHHYFYRTTQHHAPKFRGSPEIPEEVNLISPTMRGWGVLSGGRSIPRMLLPIGPDQNRDQILKFRAEMNEKLAEGPLEGGWSEIDGNLYYRPPASKTAYDPSGQIQYLRPMQEGESIRSEFYWKSGETEVAPTIGRLVLRLSAKGTTPDWIPLSGDLASVDFVPADQLDPPYEPIAPDVVPKEDLWNTMVLRRKADQVVLELNGEQVTQLPVVGYERPGLYRESGRNVHIRSMRMRGDWPESVPAKWMAE